MADRDRQIGVREARVVVAIAGDGFHGGLGCSIEEVKTRRTWTDENRTEVRCDAGLAMWGWV